MGYGLEAADKLAADGISAEVINLRSLKPLDRDTILKSVSKTHRCALKRTCGCMNVPVLMHTFLQSDVLDRGYFYPAWVLRMHLLCSVILSNCDVSAPSVCGGCAPDGGLLACEPKAQPTQGLFSLRRIALICAIERSTRASRSSGRQRCLCCVCCSKPSRGSE